MTASETPDAVQPAIPDEAVTIAQNQIAAWQMDAGNGDFYEPDARQLLERVCPFFRTAIEAELRVADDVIRRSVCDCAVPSSWGCSG